MSPVGAGAGHQSSPMHLVAYLA